MARSSLFLLFFIHLKNTFNPIIFELSSGILHSFYLYSIISLLD